MKRVQNDGRKDAQNAQGKPKEKSFFAFLAPLCG
jgi:hypothetical protein